MSTGEVIIRTEGAIGRISLNRPKAIHALTHGMCLEMSTALAGWAKDPAVGAVLLDHAEGRGFCSGGDIALIRHSVLHDGGQSARRFFFDEYRLNHQMFTWSKPIVAFMDGITMGGGVGISQPARLRVSTENTRFAMPETGIGLLPDVGGGWYLSRLPHRLGQYLGLTGARLDGAECLRAGLATHYLPAAHLAEAAERLVGGEEPDAVLAALSVQPPEPAIAAHVAEIERHFASDRLEDILASLESDPGEFAAKTLATLRTKSPQACKITLRQLAISPRLPDFAANMAMEYRAVGRAVVRPDFAEGVRAVIVDKDNNPRWTPARPEDVTDDSVEAFFAPLPANEEWRPA